MGSARFGYSHSVPATELRPLLPATNFDRLRETGLTQRECEILAWIAQGKRNADIATILSIAVKTVSKHIEHILAKLNAENRTAAVYLAREKLSTLHDRPSS